MGGSFSEAVSNLPANKINDLEFVHRYILITAPFFFIQSFPSISTIFRDFQ